MSAGLEQVVEFLEGLHFTAEELEWLARQNRFTPKFIDQLARFASPATWMPFPRDGAVRQRAHRPHCRAAARGQLVETRIMNLLHFQTMIASKAARAVLHAPDKRLVDFGLRRAQGLRPGCWPRALPTWRHVRLCYRAGRHMYGVPIFGTMAHSFIQATTTRCRH